MILLVQKMATNITVSYSVPTTVLNASCRLSHFPFKIYCKVDIITIAVYSLGKRRLKELDPSVQGRTTVCCVAVQPQSLHSGPLLRPIPSSGTSAHGPLPRACFQPLSAHGKQKPLGRDTAHQIAQTLPVEIYLLLGPTEELTFSGSRVCGSHTGRAAAC